MEKVQLLEKLNGMRIEPEGAALTFAARLASENGWSHDYAKRVFTEYRRFLFLAATAGHPVTPSDEVDQAWHLHLAYSRHYWDLLCGEILDRPLHHGPTAGGEQEDTRYLEQYERTFVAYRAAFGVEPPSDVWPDAKQRFGRRYRRVALGQHWMVPKKAGYTVVPLLTLAACTPGEWVFGGTAAVVGLVFGSAALAAIRAGSSSAKKKGKDGGCCGGTGSGCGSNDCGDSSSGCGGGGCGGGCGS